MGSCVFAGVLVYRTVTASGFPTRHAESQMDPGASYCQTFNAPTVWHWVNRYVMKFVAKLVCHRISESTK